MADPVFYVARAVEEEAGHATSAHEEHPSHSEGGTPMQAEPNLWIWTFLAFVLVFLILRKFAFPRIMEALEKRTEKIEGDIKNAELTREEADKLLADYKAQLEAARAEAKKIMDEGKALGETLRKETIEKATKEANQIIARAQEEIGREKEKALKELQSRIADISIQVASKVIQKSLSKEEHSQLIDQYVTEVGKLYEG